MQSRLTHGSNFAEDSDNNDSLENEEDGEEDQRNQLVQRVERVRAVGCNERVVPVSSPAETSIESDIASADKQNNRRTKDQSQRSKSSIIQELIADGTVHEKNPGSCDDCGDVYSRETLGLLVMETGLKDRRNSPFAQRRRG